jgi:quinol monooxygenase YgiN
MRPVHDGDVGVGAGHGTGHPDSAEPAAHDYHPVSSLGHGNSISGTSGRSYNAVMIRNVVLVRLKPGQDATAVAEIQEGLRNLDCPGTLSYTVGDDLGLREGNWSFAIVADFADEDSYQAYDQDAEHNRIRARIAAMAEQIARAQFQVPLSRRAKGF